MAEHAGATFHCFRMNADVRADYLVDAVVQNENLILMNGVAKYVLSEKVRDFGYKVVMTGEGSDEIFGGYHEFRIDKLRHHGGTHEEWREVNPRRRWIGACRSCLTLRKFIIELASCQRGSRYGGAGPQDTRGLGGRLSCDDGKCRCLPNISGFIDIAGQLTGRPRLHQSMYLWTN